MTTAYNFTLPSKKGEDISLSAYSGKVLLIVNTATGCGFTPQYEKLEDIYARLRERGFEILDIPCNQFGNQASGTDDEISEFCSLRFGTTFPQFKKSEVNGDNELALYTWLKSQAPSQEDIKWNFTKFLIDRNGAVVARFEPKEELELIEQRILEHL